MALRSFKPARSVELFIDQPEPEVTEATHHSHSTRLDHFLRWCTENDVDNLSDLTGAPSSNSGCGDAMTPTSHG